MSSQKFFADSKDTTTRTSGTIHQGGGLSKRLYVGLHTVSGKSYDHRAFLAFACDWTAIKKLESAYLVIYTDDYGFGSDFTLPNTTDPSTLAVRIRRLTADFTQGNSPDGSWQTDDYVAPANTSSKEVVSAVSKAAQELVRINVTALVEDFMPKTVLRHDTGVGGAADVATIRLMMYGFSDSHRAVSFLSKEWSDATLRPQLEINYTEGATTPNAPTVLSPSGSVASIGQFTGNFTDTNGEDYITAAQVEVYNAAHSIGSASAATNVITQAGHGLIAGSKIYFVSLTGGAGLTTFTPYYVIASGLTSGAFKVSATLGGTEVNITSDASAGTWRTRAWDSGMRTQDSVQKVLAAFAIVPEFITLRNYGYAWRARVRDNEALVSAWSGLTSFSVTNTDPNAPTLTAPVAAVSVATLDGVHFDGSFSDPDAGDAFEAFQVQLSPYAAGNANWDDPANVNWDTGKTYVAADATTFSIPYGGASLLAGTYYWRARVWDNHDGVSAWTTRQIVLSADFQADPEIANQQVQMRPRAPWRIVIKDMGALRGPGTVVAILENAKSVGASLMYNSPGEAHWTLPVDHPQISVIEPKQTHYSIQFYTGDGWREKFAGLVWDFDANERDVIFYGIDYLALYDYTMDERYDPAAPDKPYTQGGSKYVNVTITAMLQNVIDYAKNLPNSPVGFITRGTFDAMNEKVTIFSTMVPTLQLATGLIESHRAGQDKRSRVQVRPKTGGGYEIVVQDNPGSTRNNLRLKYGELVQGYRTVAFGAGWATRMNGIGRQRNGLKVNYEREIGLLDEATWGRFAKATVVSDVEDRLDLKRRVRQMAVAASMLGQALGLALRSGLVGPRDGYDVTDKFPVSVQHGAVNTDNFGHNGLWVCLGVSWEASDQGQQNVSLTLRPPDGGTAPSTSLLDSLEISTQAEWQVGWTAPTVVNPTSQHWVDQTTGKVYTKNGYGTPISITGSH